MIIITIPAYNEEKTIGKVIKGIKIALNKTKYNYKILVVDDGSKDNTVEVSKREGAIVFSHPTNLGLAETFRTELKKCLELKADVIVHTDADGQYCSSEIPKLLYWINKGYDLVLGSRFMGKIESMSLMKRLGNKAFSNTISHIIKKRVTDCQTGFRAFTRKVAENITLISNHTYTQEQIIKAVRRGFKIKEVPVYFRKRDGKSRLLKNPLEYAVKAWINLFRIYRDYTPLKFFGIFGSLFSIIGFLMGLFVFLEFLFTGHVQRTGLVMLSVLLMSMGIQIILFGFLADMFKK